MGNFSNIDFAYGNNTSHRGNTNYSHLVLYYFLGVAIVFTNVPIIVAYAVRRAVRQIVSPFLLSLVVADVLVGALTAPLIANTRNRDHGQSQIACALANSILYIPLTASVYSIVLMAVDRFVSIVWALRYHELMTNTTSTCLLLTAWTVSIIFAFIPVMTPWRDVQTFSNCNGMYNTYVFRYVMAIFIVTIPFVVVTALYIYMGILAFRHFKKIHIMPLPQDSSTSKASTTITTIATTTEVDTNHQQNARPKTAQVRTRAERIGAPEEEIDRSTTTSTSNSKTQTTKQFKAAYTSCMITIGFGLAWLPFLILRVIHISCTSGASCPGISYLPMGIGFIFTSVLFLIHSVCNPIFYIYKNKSLKRLLAAFFRCKSENSFSNINHP